MAEMMSQQARGPGTANYWSFMASAMAQQLQTAVHHKRIDANQFPSGILRDAIWFCAITLESDSERRLQLEGATELGERVLESVHGVRDQVVALKELLSSCSSPRMLTAQEVEVAMFGCCFFNALREME